MRIPQNLSRLILVLFPLLAFLTVSGCAKTSHIEKSLADAGLYSTLKITRVSTARTWLESEQGRGLLVEVWAKRTPQDYARNFDLEIDGATKVLAALETDPEIYDWSYIYLYFCIKYEPDFGTNPNVTGALLVIMRTDILKQLAADNASAADYPKFWHLVVGSKDQPNTEELLKLTSR